MNKFKSLLFWCEFPNKLNLTKLNNLFKKNNLKVRTYIAVASRKEYVQYKNMQLSNIIIEGAWPTLNMEDGYWFSGFTKKDAIDKLDDFKGINMKIDLEPPIYKDKKFSLFLFFSFIKDYILFLKKPKNTEYLQKKIKILQEHSNIILSTYPFPKILLKEYGLPENNKITCNFFYYSSLIPKPFRWLYKIYFKQFISKKDKKNNFFALGLIGPGIYGNEPVYKNIDEFKHDVEFFKTSNIQNLVIFELTGLLTRQNQDEWIRYIKSISP